MKKTRKKQLLRALIFVILIILVYFKVENDSLVILINYGLAFFNLILINVENMSSQE